MNKFEIRESDLHIRGYGNVPVADVSPFRIYGNEKIRKDSEGNLIHNSSSCTKLSFNNLCTDIIGRVLFSDREMLLCGISAHIVDNLLNEITAEEIREDGYLSLSRAGDLNPLVHIPLFYNKPLCRLQDYTKKVEVSLEDVKLASVGSYLPMWISRGDIISLTIELYYTGFSLAHHIYVILHGLMVRRREIITATKKNKPDTRFAQLIIEEAKRVYGDGFDFDRCEIVNHHDGTYDVQFHKSHKEEEKGEA